MPESPRRGRRAPNDPATEDLLGPIDVVYTWVDSSDPRWRERHALASEEAGITLWDANTEDRFLDRDELRYSLRSLDRYAPWIRKVFIVTDDQVPDWLAAEHPKVEVVDHTAIFPDTSVLPVFNSIAIEACLHRIPGLSRKFLYFNDDIFLGRPVCKSDFFGDDGIPRVRSRLKVRIDVTVTPVKTYMWHNHNAVELTRREFGRTPVAHVLDHAPIALDRDIMAETEARYSEVFAKTRASKFRSKDDVQPWVLSLMRALCTDRAEMLVTTKRDTQHVEVGSRDMAARLLFALFVRPQFYCLNSSSEPDLSFRRQARLMRAFMKLCQPRPSQYEAALPMGFEPRDVESIARWGTNREGENLPPPLLPVRSYPPGRGNVMIPATSRRGIVVGLDLHAPCRRAGVTFHRLARRAARIGGLAAVPGRKVDWKPPLPAQTWDRLVADWQGHFGYFDALAVYERTRPIRQGFSTLLLQDGRSVAFIRVREEGIDAIQREHAILESISIRPPRVIQVPLPLGMGTRDGWAWLATEALPEGPYFPSLRPPLDVITREIREALMGQLPTAPPDDSWVPMHGDLTPWNLRRGNAFYLVDWEDAGWGPPAADEVYFEAAAAVVCGCPARRNWPAPAVEFWRRSLADRVRVDPDNEGGLAMLRLLSEPTFPN